MSGCAHPAAALFSDKQTGVTTCTICGDIMQDQQYELDPLYARGARPAPAGRGGGGLRSMGGGSLRPTHAASGVPMHNMRPSIDAARRGMHAIARTLEISDDLVEMALGIYKLALNVNAVSGTRSVVLCACLYAVCRRERTSHVIYDFAEIHHDSPHAILTHMKHICLATHTEVPVVDPTCILQRLAEQMDLGDRLMDVVVCAVKVLRSMKDDWITFGRRPMGVCAAALLVACYVFNIPRSPEQVCGLVRLTANTIARRLTEFSNTPTANLESIDDYTRSTGTLPPAFNDSSRRATEDDVNADIRELSALYYELVAEAKVSTPATPERCEKWRRFIKRHCEMEQLVPTEENLDLARLSAQDQLRILGLPYTQPITQCVVEESVKREEERLILKQETGAEGGGVYGAFHSTDYPVESLPVVAQHSPSQTGEPDFQNMAGQYRQLLETNTEIRGLCEDFDFTEDFGLTQTHHHQSSTQIKTDATQMDMPYASQHSSRSLPMSPTALSPLAGSSGPTREQRIALEEMMRDKEHRHALPWEFLVLQKADIDDSTDILPYLVLDNEERLRRQKVGEALYKDQWARGRARTREEIQHLEDTRQSKRRRRHVIKEPASVNSAVERALRGRGAASVNISQIAEIIPGLVGEDEGHVEWED